jgi:hypothetical protein
MFPLNTILAWNINIIMNKKYDNNNIIIASRAYFLHGTVVDEPPPAQLDPFKIPIKIVERVMNNCYSGDGTIHPGDHLLFIHELCELFKCAGISSSQVKRKLFSLSLKGRAAEWYKLLKNGRSIGWEEIVPLFYSKFYPPSEIHKDDGESTAQAWGRLKSLMLKCLIHELLSNIIINNFYARLSLHDKDIYWMLLVLDHLHI